MIQGVSLLCFDHILLAQTHLELSIVTTKEWLSAIFGMMDMGKGNLCALN